MKNKPTFTVSLDKWDKLSSIARVQINSRESQLLASVLAAVKHHWGKRRMQKELAAL